MLLLLYVAENDKIHFFQSAGKDQRLQSFLNLLAILLYLTVPRNITKKISGMTHIYPRAIKVT